MHVKTVVTIIRVDLTPEALNYFMKTLETEGFFQFEIIINVLVSSFRFI